MKPYFFKIKVKPKPENQKASDIAGAYAHIWVMADNMNAAESQAIHYISEHLWETIEVELSEQIQPEQIAHLGKAESTVYRRALNHGISADFHAWP